MIEWVASKELIIIMAYMVSLESSVRNLGVETTFYDKGYNSAENKDDLKSCIK